MTNTKNLEAGQRIRINGRRTVYTVTKAGEMGADVQGPRGGSKTIVQNIHSGRLSLIWVQGLRGRSEPVETIEVV